MTDATPHPMWQLKADARARGLTLRWGCPDPTTQGTPWCWLLHRRDGGQLVAECPDLDAVAVELVAWPIVRAEP